MSWSIKVENLSKRYQISHVTARIPYRTLREDLVRAATAPVRWLRGHRVQREDFWALKDVSFEVEEGEVLGVIGRNGAGKSTLLKILSRITKPTSGCARFRGRIGSLLEVGTGFHPELTGRENIYLSGAVLGMTRREIQRKFDEIVAFAEVEKFLDTPAKRYSSGMYVRLAFAVAAHLEPEILLIDEVLAVGDAAFQKKCLGKMSQVASEGRTVLFVSHNMTAVASLCRNALMLDSGEIQSHGQTDAVVKNYLSRGAAIELNRIWDCDQAPGNESIRILGVNISPSHGDLLSIDSGVDLEVVFNNLRDRPGLDFTCYLHNELGIMLFESGLIISEQTDAKKGVYRVRGQIPGHLLNAGRYHGTILFGEYQRYPIYRFEEAFCFEVANTSTGRGSNLGVAPGVIRPRLQWSVSCSLEPRAL